MSSQGPSAAPSVTRENCERTYRYLREKQRNGVQLTAHERLMLERLERALERARQDRHQGVPGQQQQTPTEISQVLRAQGLRGGLRCLDGASSDLAGMTDGQKQAVHSAMQQIPAWSLISGETRASLTGLEFDAEGARPGRGTDGAQFGPGRGTDGAQLGRGNLAYDASNPTPASASASVDRPSVLGEEETDDGMTTKEKIKELRARLKQRLDDLKFTMKTSVDADIEIRELYIRMRTLQMEGTRQGGAADDETDSFF
ncbi:hypothetical protein QBC39DRAFT_374574 [Podospora conica]|nr:hypothetical protein QBC39DRAFT_374574 [Schizothecium conicum]